MKITEMPYAAFWFKCAVSLGNHVMRELSIRSLGGINVGVKDMLITAMLGLT